MAPLSIVLHQARSSVERRVLLGACAIEPKQVPMSSPPRSPPADAQETARELLNTRESISDEDEPNDGQNNTSDSRDYTTRMDEILGDDDERAKSDEEPFDYSGVDAPTEAPRDYDSQLRDILGPDDESEDREVEVELRQFDDSDEFESQTLEQNNSDSYPTPDPKPISSPVSPQRVISPEPQDPLKRPAFLHPHVSRLRSFVPQDRHSSASHASFTSQGGLPVPSAAASHFSAISRSSSRSRLSDHSIKPTRDAFRWTTLQTASSLTHSASLYGRATVLAANGLICLGTSSSRALIFDFRQQLKHVIMPPNMSTMHTGAVTAIALSTDHTYVAVGHARGHIFLYDLSSPQNPVRTVEPVSLKAVLAGRKEGHLIDTPVTHVSFVGARHTAIVSADASGLAFYHSLGKVLFVEASDIVRILGRYPTLGETPIGPATEAPLRPDVKGKGKATDNANHTRPSLSVIIRVASLPLGTIQHPTDAYQIQALITPSKLIVVGFKPAPKTWFRRHNPNQESRSEPLLAWFPAYGPSDDTSKQGNYGREKSGSTTAPVLVYTWGNILHFLGVKEDRITQRIRDEKKGKIDKLEVGTLTFDELNTIYLGEHEQVRALQWLNVQQLLVVVRPAAFLVYDVPSGTRVESVELNHSWLHPVMFTPQMPASVSHNVKVYKGKTFILGNDELRVGTLLSWADHILNCVKLGDFIGSIDLAREYYTSTAPGSTYGLPLDPRPVVGAKLHELMASSAQFAFSEQRMREGSGANSDPMLYPRLVEACAKACVAMGDMSFFYDDLWEDYSEHGIGAIFLDTLIPLVLDNTVPSNIPPVVSQRLVAHCDERDEYKQAEKLIWHIDPECLDVNHAIGLCKRHALYDALIYVYNAGLRDYVSPIVEFLSLIRDIQKRRREDSGSEALETYLEDAVPNAYKVYDYLNNILTGLLYPSKRRMEEGADQAKSSVYSFLCFGRSSTWAGKLVLTAAEDGGVEPPYPYLRQLLRFDAEALLNSLDIAFEDSYLNGPDEAVSRQVIINILLDVLASPSVSSSSTLSASATNFIRIFIARNVPKYPQFIRISPSVLHRILVALASDSDSDTREDRQLAAEFLLSVYNPTGESELRELFKRAGFFRILRSMYRTEKQWVMLAEAYLQDPGVGAHELFTNLEEILERTRTQQDQFDEIVTLIQNYLHPLVQLGLTQTAYLLDKFAPTLHVHATELLKAEHLRFKYLRALVQPHLAWEMDDDDQEMMHIARAPSQHLDASLQREYLSLMCQEEPETVLPLLESDSGASFDVEQIIDVCSQRKMFNVIVWAINRDRGAESAIKQLEEFQQNQTAEIIQWISAADETSEEGDYPVEPMARLNALSITGVRLCEQAKQEDLWFQLLRAQIRTVQSVVSIGSVGLERAQLPINELRTTIQTTFSALTAQSSSEQLSFPRLFRRLLDSSQEELMPTKNTYNEFRLILTGMLEAYRAEGDVLGITKRLVEQDLFEVMNEHVLARRRGWRNVVPVCAGCNSELSIKQETGNGSAGSEENVANRSQLMLMASGVMYHQACVPVSVA
ncbi:vacuolar protein sorting-associated-like protein [Rhizoctonia solani AG-3 Rhs1AP]|uniref:Vacuolar protein sorting-associated-like protein n=1 Tax=Rhizoctonia solani AG-3 Rhs1AP TaxID=1086054 RepID=X8JLG8_9AGAM|nr:vacuolar protein sorting-associated-like protein [Rhizoctonia solani AG-3 Rhs1AP]